MNRKAAEQIIDTWERTGSISDDDLAAVERFVEDRPDEAAGLTPMLSLLRRDAATVTAGRHVTSGAEDAEHRSDETFTASVMSQVRSVPVPTSGQRRHAATVAALALAAALAVVIGVWQPWAAGGAASSSVEERGMSDIVTVRFELIAPEAHSVALVGDFNDWEEKTHVLHMAEDGTWVIDMTLRRGELYSYNFLVDEERWVPDPQADYQIRDPFGGEKSVVSL